MIAIGHTPWWKRFFFGIFWCSHPKLTFPLTNKKAKFTWVTCLDCGKEFTYDMSALKGERE